MTKNSLHLALWGASGRLGKTIATLAIQDSRFCLRAALTHARSPHLGQDLGLLLKQDPLRLLLTTRLETSVDLAIDASLPEGFAFRLGLVREQRLPFVVGTTALTKSDREQMEDASSHIPIFYASNFSLGMALMHRWARLANAFLPPDTRIDLTEAHHRHKKDAPSGSARLLAQEALAPRDVAIHSLRSGDVIGTHRLTFETAEEALVLKHEVHSREAFARGALTAALFLHGKKPGLYGMEDL